MGNNTEGKNTSLFLFILFFYFTFDLVTHQFLPHTKTMAFLDCIRVTLLLVTGMWGFFSPTFFPQTVWNRQNLNICTYTMNKAFVRSFRFFTAWILQHPPPPLFPSRCPSLCVQGGKGSMETPSIFRQLHVLCSSARLRSHVVEHIGRNECLSHHTQTATAAVLHAG